MPKFYQSRLATRTGPQRSEDTDRSGEALRGEAALDSKEADSAAVLMDLRQLAQAQDALGDTQRCLEHRVPPIRIARHEVERVTE